MTAAMEGRALGAALIAALLVAGCGRLSDADALAVVRAYDSRVIEAFRTGDARPVEAVAGPEEAKKLTALVGVKRDMGIFLDARLELLVPDSVERAGGEIAVRTRERWYYQDRRLDTGEQVGQDSTDLYEMRYVLQRLDGRWVVTRVEFVAPPIVGRTQAPTGAPASVFHGVMPSAVPMDPAAPISAGAGAPR